MGIMDSGVLAVIPARGGSKSIPKKNIRLLGGKPLIAYSIASGKSSPLIDRVIVSTDNEQIAGIAKDYGAEVPFLRPKELAQDNTSDLPVFQHALQWLYDNENYQPDIIVHLRPTNPFRTVSDIDEAIELLQNNPNAHSVRGVSIPLTSPYKMYRLKKHGLIEPLFLKENPNAHNMPRQELPTVYRGNGNIDITRWNTMMKLISMTGIRILPFLIEEERCVDIDTQEDWDYAEWLCETNRRNLPY